MTLPQVWVGLARSVLPSLSHPLRSYYDLLGDVLLSSDLILEVRADVRNGHVEHHHSDGHQILEDHNEEQPGTSRVGKTDLVSAVQRIPGEPNVPKLKVVGVGIF